MTLLGRRSATNNARPLATFLIQVAGGPKKHRDASFALATCVDRDHGRPASMKLLAVGAALTARRSSGKITTRTKQAHPAAIIKKRGEVYTFGLAHELKPRGLASGPPHSQRSSSPHLNALQAQQGETPTRAR